MVNLRLVRLNSWLHEGFQRSHLYTYRSTEDRGEQPVGLLLTRVFFSTHDKLRPWANNYRGTPKDSFNFTFKAFWHHRRATTSGVLVLRKISRGEEYSSQ